MMQMPIAGEFTQARKETFQTMKMMWRWSIMSTGLTVLFWWAWWLIRGNVPVIDSIILEPGHDLQFDLPYAVSRLWDVVMIPFWTVSIVLILTRKVKDGYCKMSTPLFSGLLIGLCLGTQLFLNLGLGMCLIVGIATAIIGGFILGLMTGQNARHPISHSMPCAMAYSLGNGLGVSVTLGLVLGSIYAFGIAAMFGIFIGVGMISRRLCTKEPWHSLTNWLMARD